MEQKITAPMKIFIPYPVKDIGGTSIFIKKFQEGMQARGHEVFFKYRPDYDYIFAIVVCFPQYLIQAKLKEKKIIQRLDGMFYYSVSGWNYLRLNFSAWIIRKFFSDYTIYQSHYSKYCAEKFLGKRKKEKYSLIYNGTDINKFSPEGENLKNTLKDNPDQQLLITASQFRREDQIVPIIDAMYQYKKKYTKNFKFIIVGEFTGKIKNLPDKYKSAPFLEFVGKIKNENLPSYLRSADCFLITHLNPPCPNNVIEAMACGLPICGVNDGAMSELTEQGKNSLLIPTRGDAFWKMRILDTEKFADNLAKIIKNKETYSKNSRETAVKRFDLDIMIDKYIQIFENINKI